MIQTRLWAATLALVLLALSGCIGVQIHRGVRDPEAYFERAEREIARLARLREDRPGRVHRLHVLAYDRRDGELVRVSVPLWMAELAVDIGEHADRDHHDIDIEERYDVDWRALRRLDRFGPGLLAAVTSDRDRLLVWLD
jgi:hypothetical protein